MEDDTEELDEENPIPEKDKINLAEYPNGVKVKKPEETLPEQMKEAYPETLFPKYRQPLIQWLRPEQEEVKLVEPDLPKYNFMDPKLEKEKALRIRWEQQKRRRELRAVYHYERDKPMRSSKEGDREVIKAFTNYTDKKYVSLVEYKVPNKNWRRPSNKPAEKLKPELSLADDGRTGLWQSSMDDLKAQKQNPTLPEVQNPGAPKKFRKRKHPRPRDV